MRKLVLSLIVFLALPHCGGETVGASVNTSPEGSCGVLPDGQCEANGAATRCTPHQGRVYDPVRSCLQFLPRGTAFCAPSTGDVPRRWTQSCVIETLDVGVTRVLLTPDDWPVNQAGGRFRLCDGELAQRATLASTCP